MCRLDFAGTLPETLYHVTLQEVKYHLAGPDEQWGHEQTNSLLHPVGWGAGLSCTTLQVCAQLNMQHHSRSLGPSRRIIREHAASFEKPGPFLR